MILDFATLNNQRVIGDIIANWRNIAETQRYWMMHDGCLNPLRILGDALVMNNPNKKEFLPTPAGNLLHYAMQIAYVIFKAMICHRSWPFQTSLFAPPSVRCNAAPAQMIFGPNIGTRHLESVRGRG